VTTLTRNPKNCAPIQAEGPTGGPPPTNGPLGPRAGPGRVHRRAPRGPTGGQK
jgi:hypothetical protein